MLQRDEIADTDRMALHRIVVLLLALADLADEACGRSLAIRRAVLWLLRPGETIARDYVAALTGNPHPAGEPVPVDGDGRAEAARLAHAFRILAELIAAFGETLSAGWQVGPARQAGWRGLAALTVHRAPMSTVQRRDSS